jgi:hypothetical protein
MNLMANMKGYDWATWFMGIMRSIIAGGATSILNTGGTALIVPSAVNTGTGLHTLLSLVAVYFIIGAITHMAIYLSTHGAPDQLQQNLTTAAAANVEAGKAIASAQTNSQEPAK